MSTEQPHRTWFERLHEFDRRWLFLAMGVAVILPLIAPLNLPVEPSPMVKAAYYSIEALEKGDRVFLALDLDPASTPELEPFYRAVLLQLKRKNVKLVIATTWYAAPPLIERWIRESIQQPLIGPDDKDYKGVPDRAYKEDVDYVWLGFREGRQAVINQMASNLRNTFDNHSANGRSLDDLEIMNGIKSLADFDMVVMVSAGFPGIKEYVQQAQARGNVKMVGACTAVSTTDYSPYYDAGQLMGLVGGMAKAAEYEKLVGKVGSAAKGTDVLNFGHLVVILAIIMGNLIYFVNRRRGVVR